MKIPVFVILAGCAAAFMSTAAPLHAQACKDEADAMQAMIQDVAATVDSVKKESQADFDTKYHRKACLNKLTFAVGAIGDAVECFNKAAQDASAAAEQKSAAAAAGASDAKLKDRLAHYRDSLKSTPDGKAAKALIATFDLSAAAAP